MKKENIYLDLSKCTEEERKHIFSMLPEPRNWKVYSIIDNKFFLNYNYDEWIVGSKIYIENKTEITYPEFIKLFEGGEGVRTELLPDAAYWRYRCLLAEKCLSVSPCDTDITEEQIKAHKDYNQYLETFGNKD